VIAADSQISITDLLGKVHLSFCCLASDTKLVMGGKEVLAKKTGKRSDLQFNSYGEIVSAVLAKDLPYELGGVTYAFSEGCKVSFASETQTFPALSSLKYVYAYSEIECTAILGKTADDSYKRDPATGKLTHLSSGITEYYLPLKK
jgi:hypothetical protein